MWGLGIVLAAHAGYLLKGLFGLHVGLYAAVNVGLFVIDATYSGRAWFYWPLFTWGALLAIHGYGGRRVMRAASERARLNWEVTQPQIAPLTMDEVEPPSWSCPCHRRPSRSTL